MEHVILVADPKEFWINLSKSVPKQEPFVPCAARQGSILAMCVMVRKPTTDTIMLR
jgi:hypothetical protein